jgi:hypothetical protein
VPLGLSGPLNPLADPGDAPPPGPTLNPLAATPKLGTAPTPADAYDANSQAYTGWLAQQRASGVASGMIDPDTGWPTQNALVDAAHQWGSAMIAGTGAPGEGFTAFHGSPHSFDQFQSSAIGTGEGAQAYGHGLYFADKESIAQSYRDKLTGDRGGMDYLDANGARANYGDLFDKAHAATSAIPGATPDIRRAIPLQIMDAMEAGTPPEKFMTEYDVDPKYAPHYQAAADALAGVTHSPNKGSMYEVNINADPAHFLDWDKPLSQQSPHVQAVINKVADNSTPLTTLMMKAEKGTIPPLAGRDVIQSLSKGGDYGDPAIAQKLHAAGIPGIRYLDGGSRANGQGSSNHVIFDPATIEILRKYGIAGLMAGGAAAATQGQPTQ